jgi:DNA helicase-2/ATP-dependent DNA helicase PcrA
MLASSSRNICGVGDDDQSIYSWRGADIRNILNFEKDYPNAEVITLSENYRSTKPILDAAASVIRNNPTRKEKTIISCRGEGEPPVYCRCANEYSEAHFVVNSMISLKNREGYANRDFAIFYRTNAQSRVFEQMLQKEGIPYRLIGGQKFYDRKEIKDIVSYLRLLCNPMDTVSLNRIINLPPRGIGPATLERIHIAARDEGTSAWNVIQTGNIPGKIPAG